MIWEGLALPWDGKHLKYGKENKKENSSEMTIQYTQQRTTGNTLSKKVKAQ